MIPSPEPRESFQTQFHLRWNQLNDPHVRALAWLLDAPDLLDPQAPRWQGRIASLPGGAATDTEQWLLELDHAPAALHAYLGVQPFTRLGRYAEKLMAFYFQHQGTLVAHGVQVRAGKNDTVGEFDFLLRDGATLVHWEFATKFYLLQLTGAAEAADRQDDYFVGPNLADTLGAKMNKILNRQLALAQHPAAQIHLPQPVAAAQALVKGWLFYHNDDPPAARSLGVSDAHCRGFWCTQAELDARVAGSYVDLPRLSWLAPAKVHLAKSVSKQSLQDRLSAHFERDTMPVMVALLEEQGDYALETSRGFIVPDDWRNRAAEKMQPAARAHN
jgi:hypothetical protein